MKKIENLLSAKARYHENTEENNLTENANIFKVLVY